MTPTLSDLLSTARVVKLPLRTKFRGLTEREILLFEGSQGWAEWSPFVEYETEEASVWLKAAIDWAFNPQPEPLRNFIAVNATLPAVDASEVEEVLARFGRFSTVKIKVGEPGQTIVDDMARILRVKVLYPDAKIRLDANGIFSIEQALALIAALEHAHIKLEYFEQPVSTIAELAELRLQLKKNGTELLIAADESVRKTSDPMAVVHAAAADLLVLKAAPLGGVSQTLAISQQANLPSVVSSALESSVGLSMGLHLAACLPDFEMANGLATAQLLAADVCSQPLLAENGSIELRRVAPESDYLDRFQADEEHTEWWLERLSDCAAELGIQ